MARTIYKVEEGSPGKAPGGPRPPVNAEGWEPTAPLRIKRRRLIYVLAGIIFLTIVMVIIIAALGASESPAVGTVTSSPTATTVPVVFTEPVGTSTTIAEVQQTASSTVESATSSSQTVAAAQPTSSTYYTDPIGQPVRVVIPTLGVDAPMAPVGLKNGTSSMEIPAVGIVGWYKLGTVPGGSGPSVLVSHVSWQGKKGAFYNLKKLKAGDQVEVYDADGHKAVFAVDSLETILKADLPTERIWSATQQAVIRLITCGGQYNSATGHYLSNVIVYGHLVK